MPLTFPSSPSNGETYVVGSRTWTWNGSIWEINGTAAGVASVGETELTSDAVTTAKIANSAITTAKIANSSVTVAKIESNPTFTGTVTLPANTSIGNVSSTEISYVDGVTSAIQTQIDTKSPLTSPTFTGTVVLPATTSIGTVSNTEISYVDGVTSAIQTQLNAKAALAGPTFTGTVVLPSTTSIGTVDSTEIGYLDGVTSSIQTQMNTKAPLASPTFTGLTTTQGGSIGSTVGSRVNCFEAYASSSNGEALITRLQKMVAAGDWTNNAWMIQKRVDVTDMGFIKFGTYDVRMGGSGTADGFILDNGGSIVISGSGATKASGTTWANPSDERIKDNIRDYNKGTAELMQVRVREWEYNGKGGTVEGTKGLGVVADEVMLVLPNTVDTYEAKLESDDEENTNIKRFDATEITWLLVKTVQQQQAVIENQQAMIEQLTARLDALGA
jgi:hypothetical protein